MYKPRFKVVLSNERILSPSGLGIVGGMLAKSDFVKRCNRIPVDKKRSEPQIKNGDILLTYIGLLCQAKTPLEAPHPCGCPFRTAYRRSAAGYEPLRFPVTEGNCANHTSFR